MTTPFAGTPQTSSNLERRAGYDVWLLAATIGLCICGAIFVWTSSAAHAWKMAGGDSATIFWSHIGRMGWGLVCMTVLSFVDYHILNKQAARFAILLALAALVAVLFIPQPAGATAHRWIYIRGFSFQPAELAKFALINYLAFRFGEHFDDPFSSDRRKVYVGSLIISVFVIGLILVEPNLSMTVLVFGTAALLFFLSGIRLKPLLILAGASAIPLSLAAWLTPYMRSRLTAYVDGIVDPLRAGYHVKQSLIGIGHGGVTGLGLGGSTQKHFFLPEPYKDFIFSIVGEEAGLIGSLLLLAGFGLFLARAWKIARHAPDSYGYYLAAGITCAIAISLTINVGVTLGLLPATGQPLPFISYGGSSLMMTLGAVGVLLNISKQSQRHSDSPHQPYRFK
ncbi:MAG TPA: FtsW/RodA/SpoVE family cell cycle protein [bacterium]|jgi:cell division protein FtsW